MTALLSFSAVEDIADGDGRTALMWAAQRGNYTVLKAMLEREGNVHACDKLGATGKLDSLIQLPCVLSEGS